ncbi:MAG: adenylyltransferase/cytidyltransferase family protein [Lachnospiraceae bacterium]|nr:adenylyltransferase/cytidyltransferase family protein [Lachnospiraceae bacterium]
MGVTEVSIYDPLRDYPRKRHPIVTEQTSADKVAEPGSAGKEKKKYHTGYISGVWDLFHVGHLNIFKRAKEQCEYLIVGVVSDKGVIRFKGVAPFVPFEERIELVRACRYVDEAVEIPVEMNGPKEALAMYHFDVQFQGSDHMNEDYWIQMRDYLREHGADMVFFPYTMSTNSTNIKKLIEKKLV